MSNTIEDDHKVESALTKTFLNLEEIDPLLFRSTHLFKPTFGRAVFGGQVVGQALVAASNTVDKGREVHSLHCYFLRPGKIDNPILYQVLKIRDGITYSNRFVRATQLGKIVFTMMVSFKSAEANTYSHQFTMPDVPGPEGLLDATDILKQRLEKKDIASWEKYYIEKRLTEEITMIAKPVDPRCYLRKTNLDARQCTWLKVMGHIGDNQQMQRCAAAYMSDSFLLGTALLPGASQLHRGQFFMASIDHSIWFHHPIQADEWLLYEMESPKCDDGRALCNGRFWDRNGSLRMSVSQEGLIKSSNKSRESTHCGPNVDQRRHFSHVSVTGGGCTRSLTQQSQHFTAVSKQTQISAVNSLLYLSRRLVRLM